MELGFCRDLGCNDKIDETTNKCTPLIAAFWTHWIKVEFVAITVGNMGTTSTKTLKSLTSALSNVRPHVETIRANMDLIDPTTNTDAKAHDTVLIRFLLDSLTYLAQYRLIGIIRNRQRLIEALPGVVNRTRAYSVTTPLHPQATQQHDVAPHTLRLRTIRFPENTAIT